MCFYSSGKCCFTTHIYDVKPKGEENSIQSFDTQDNVQDNTQDDTQEKMEGKENV